MSGSAADRVDLCGEIARARGDQLKEGESNDAHTHGSS